MESEHRLEEVVGAIDRLHNFSVIYEKLKAASMTVVRSEGKDVQQYHITLSEQERLELGAMIRTMEDMVQQAFGRDIQNISESRC